LVDLGSFGWWITPKGEDNVGKFLYYKFAIKKDNSNRISKRQNAPFSYSCGLCRAGLKLSKHDRIDHVPETKPRHGRNKKYKQEILGDIIPIKDIFTSPFTAYDSK
jgi:hypothetical protein